VTGLAAAAAGVSPASAHRVGMRSKGAPFQIFAVLPLSGPYASIGLFAKEGLQAAVSQINTEGGVLGHKAVLVTADDAGSPTTAVTAVQQAVSSGKAYDELIPGCLSAEGLVLAPLLASHDTLQMSTGATDALNDPTKYPHWYMAASGFTQYDVALVQEMKQRGIRKFAIVNAATTSGEASAYALQRAAKSYGLTVTTTVLVPAGTASATPQLQQAQASGPQAVAIGANTTETGPILQARYTLGWTVPVYGDAAMAATDFSTIVSTPAALKGVTVQTFPFLVKGNAATTTPQYKKFLSLIYKVDPNPPASMYEATSSWDEVMVARAAAELAKSIQPAKVAKAVSNLGTATRVPDWIGAPQVFPSGSHEPVLSPGSFTYVPAAPQVKGLVVEPTA
jgi:branched-chain amino acid transport system substrate-binding protein